jgi:hypothetical protein
MAQKVFFQTYTIPHHSIFLLSFDHIKCNRLLVPSSFSDILSDSKHYQCRFIKFKRHKYTNSCKTGTLLLLLYYCDGMCWLLMASLTVLFFISACVCSTQICICPMRCTATDVAATHINVYQAL